MIGMVFSFGFAVILFFIVLSILGVILEVTMDSLDDIDWMDWWWVIACIGVVLYWLFT